MWGSDTFALKPDILTTAKALSAAYMPISAVMISDPIFQSLVEQSAKIGVFWPWFHLFRSSGGSGGSAGDHKNLRRTEHHQACAEGIAAFPEGPAAVC